MTTLKQAKEQLKRIGVSIKKTDGEYKINYAHSTDEATAYYTDDIDDAVSTAIHAYSKKG